MRVFNSCEGYPRIIEKILPIAKGRGRVAPAKTICAIFLSIDRSAEML